MRWRDPDEGAVRRVTAFLWFAKRIKGETRWLELATWSERYVKCKGIGLAWCPWEWIE